MYRKLYSSEIKKLVAQGCSADDWQNIEVVDDFSTEWILRVRFSGQNRLGKFDKIFTFDSGVELHSGIFDATVHNCVIYNDVYLSNIGTIANYEVGEGCFIRNVDNLTCTQGCSFGNGVMVAAVNENGGRAIPIFDKLSAQLAYMLTYYRHHQHFTQTVFATIDDYCGSLRTRQRGTIGKRAKITETSSVINVRIGDMALIEGATRITNGTVGERSLVGNSVIARDFVAAADSRIDEAANVERCFVGEGCIVTKGFSAVDCLMFANGEFANGEAVSAFAAPYTVSHHRSSLIIACGLSFANIGSGTNMSNHAYRLGAVHQSVIERGCKFGSNSYLLSPSYIGDYTIILGSHKNHPDTHEFPFSYLVEDGGQSILIPAVNIFRVVTLRDIDKWQDRDRRQSNSTLDIITYDMLNPFIIGKIEKAIDILENLRNDAPDAEYYEYKNCKIHSHSLRKGIGYYRDAITMFLGDFVIGTENSEHSTKAKYDCNEWIDVSGLIAPKAEIKNIIDNPQLIDKDNFGINIFRRIDNDYNKCLAAFVAEKYGAFDRQEILVRYTSVLDTIERRLIKEADTEFFGDSQTGYGLDFEEERANDFEAVRGSTRNNRFIMQTSEMLRTKIEKAKQLCKKE